MLIEVGFLHNGHLWLIAIESDLPIALPQLSYTIMIVMTAKIYPYLHVFNLGMDFREDYSALYVVGF